MKRLLSRKRVAGDTAGDQPTEGKTRDADGKQLKQSSNDVVISHVDFYNETLKNSNAQYLYDGPRQRRARTRRR